MAPLEERTTLSTAAGAGAAVAHAVHASTAVRFPGGSVHTGHGARVRFPGGFVISIPGGHTTVKFPGGMINSLPGSSVVTFPGGFVNSSGGGTVVTFPGGSVVIG